MTEIKRQLPNFLSLLRIPMAILCGYFAITLKTIPLTISLFLFILACATDFLDGYLARRWKTVSNFGKIIDPIADKILIVGVFIVFAYNGIVPLIVTILIAFREILLTVIRILLLPKKVVLAARFSGKLKTASQFFVLVVIYLFLIFAHPFKDSINETFIRTTIMLLTIWTVWITLYSGLEFLIINIKAIRKLV